MEQFAGISVSQSVTQIVEVGQITPPERVVEVSVRQVLTEIVEEARVAPSYCRGARASDFGIRCRGREILMEHVRIFERICEQIVEAPVEQAAEQVFAVVVALPVHQTLKGIDEVVNPALHGHRLWQSRLHKRQCSCSHVWFLCQCVTVGKKPLRCQVWFFVCKLLKVVVHR